MRNYVNLNMLIMSGTNGTIIPHFPSQEFPLNVFLQQLSKKLTEEEFEDLKFLCQGKGGIRKGDMSQLKTTLDLFTILREREIITNENLLTLQAMIWHIGRKDLYKEFFRFCGQLDNTLYFIEAPEKTEDEQEHVKFHVMGYKAMTDLYKLRGAVSKILCCPERYVIIRGIEQCNSLWITFMIPDWCTDILMCLSIESWKVLVELTVDKLFIQSVTKEIVCPFNIQENEAENEHADDTDMIHGKDIDPDSATISLSDLNTQRINKREGRIYSNENEAETENADNTDMIHGKDIDLNSATISVSDLNTQRINKREEDDEPREKSFEEKRKFWLNRLATATVHSTATKDQLKFKQRNQTFRGRKASLDTNVTTSESTTSVQDNMHKALDVQCSEKTETEKDFVLASIEDKDNENDINNRTDITRKRNTKANREGVYYLHEDTTSQQRADSGFLDFDSKET